jgi:hypothetical protein
MLLHMTIFHKVKVVETTHKTLLTAGPVGSSEADEAALEADEAALEKAAADAAYAADSDDSDVDAAAGPEATAASGYALLAAEAEAPRLAHSVFYIKACMPTTNGGSEWRWDHTWGSSAGGDQLWYVADNRIVEFQRYEDASLSFFCIASHFFVSLFSSKFHDQLISTINIITASMSAKVCTISCVLAV